MRAQAPKSQIGSLRVCLCSCSLKGSYQSVAAVPAQTGCWPHLRMLHPPQDLICWAMRSARTHTSLPCTCLDLLQTSCKGIALSAERQSQERIAKLQRSNTLGSWEMGVEASACSAAKGGQMTCRCWADLLWDDKLDQRQSAPNVKTRRPEAKLREASHLHRSLGLQSYLSQLACEQCTGL